MENDDKKTGRNIKYIRNANKISSADFADSIGVSDSLLQKIESGARHAADDLLYQIARNAGIPFSQIKYGDLSYLEKGELSFDEDLKIDLISEMLYEDVQELYSTLFPIVEGECSLRSDEFAEGIRIAHAKIQRLVFTVEECRSAIRCFANALADEGCADHAAINILSCLGYLYVFRYKSAGLGKRTESLLNEKVSSGWGFTAAFYSKSDARIAAEKKKEFLERYGDILGLCLKKLTASGENADYACYYLGLRYLFGMMDEAVTLFDEQQMADFGRSMLRSLGEMGNKYAQAFCELQESEEDA